ncbi:hypothetical protein ACFL5W_01645 [Thermodesulfobacteriota bacterium]
MDIPLIKFSEQEHKLIERAPVEYGDIYSNTHDLIFLSWNFLERIEHKGEAFSLFFGQINKTLIQCMLAAIRKHCVQFHAMLRHIIEYASLAAYSTYETDMHVFYHEDENKCLVPEEKTTVKAYKWLDANYPIHSGKLHQMKDTINNTYSHASILPTIHNLKFSQTEVGLFYFDDTDKIFTEQYLWWIGDIIIGILELLYDLLQKNPVAIVTDNYLSTMNQLVRNSIYIRARLMSDPTFFKWKEK